MRASPVTNFAQPDFREDLYRARELRGDWAFGDQILAIADDTDNDYKTALNGRKVPDKELVLRSKVRIEARQFHMRQLHPTTWGERTQVDVNDMTQLTVEERLRKAAELLDLVQVNHRTSTDAAAPGISSRRAGRR